jgi:predicted 3-demethylubiquinone-9 3-methyltransferase (glyoxalase superfamily)
MADIQQKITPFLWFDKEAEEAMKFYTSVFKNSKIISIQRYPDVAIEEHMKGMEGKVLTGVFELEGQRFMALDGGSVFKFNESISFYVACDGQEEVDYFWEKLSAVPESEQCGWLKDKFGVSWQIIPKQMGELLSSPEKDKAERAVLAMLQMKKIDLSKLEEAFDGKE